MKKKEAPKFKEIKGWNLLTNVRSYCTACGHLVDFGQPLYWKKSDGREVRNCGVCVEDEGK